VFHERIAGQAVKEKVSKRRELKAVTARLTIRHDDSEENVQV
jgi:outer membrane lipoprotein SlyB